MADLFKMPMLGQTMEEGTVLRWFKQEGDAVKRGETLLEVMSDKANIEVEAPEDGVLHKILVAADQTVPVHTPIAVLGAPGEAYDHLLAGGVAAPPALPVSAAQEAPAAVHAAAPPLSTAAGIATGVAISPRAHRLADQRGVPITALTGSGPRGRIIERDILAYLARPEAAVESRARVSPLAARVADDLGVDVDALAMGLPGSRVTVDLVRHAAEARPAAAAMPAPAGGGPAIAEIIPFRGIRKAIADNVARSRQTAPHVTLTAEIDMTEAMALVARLRPEVERAYETKLTVTDLIIKAAARALANHPLCNAALIGDEIRVYADRNISVAVAAENGLIVPVIKGADRKSVGEISVELKALAGRCRAGKQSQDDLAGGTFTITNLGAFGIDVFDPILVPPQACILGVCRVVEKPVVRGGEVVVRSMMNLCLSFDHRVLDGVPGSRFLQRMRELLESPLSVFV